MSINGEKAVLPEQFCRSAALYGEELISRLLSSSVIVFGLGGVGAQAAMTLCRAGVGRLTLVDSDSYAVSNINRQAGAFHSSVGEHKADYMKRLLEDINPGAEIFAKNIFYSAETQSQLDFSGVGCVIDAIDTVSSKLLIIENAKRAGVPVVSCMGAGNKLDPSAFRVGDIYESSGCPLARVMRSELRKRGIEDVRVVYSSEPPQSCAVEGETRASGRPVPASNSFCPPVAGILAAWECVRLLAMQSKA